MNKVVNNILEQSKLIQEDSAESLQFCSDAFVALSAVEPDLVQTYLESTRVLPWFKKKEQKLLPEIKKITFQFFYELKTLQISKDGQTFHFPLTSATELLNEHDLNFQIEGIISRGFLLQPNVYEVSQLTEHLDSI